MTNAGNYLLGKWYELLNGVISVPVYRTDAPAEEEGDYVLLRIESDSDRTNNARFTTSVVIITEVVTKFKVAIDEGVAIDIDSEIGQRLFIAPGLHRIEGGGEIRRESAQYLPEDDGTHKYHRIIRRNVHRVQESVIS